MAKGITKKPRRDAPVWGRIVRCIDPVTRESFLAWRALPGDDATEMRQRGYREGDEISAEFRADRNIKNFRQAHALAQFVLDNTEAFPPGVDSHEAIKRIQRDADIECDEQTITIDLGTFGKHEASIRVPRSLSFSTMDQEVWRTVYKALKDHIVRTYFADWNAAQIAEFDDILRGNQRT